MKAYIVTSDSVNPYINLGYEEWLLQKNKEDEVVFYLWQNQHTVVIGKNQNAFKEAKVAQLESTGGSLARRSSGGGAVYHDLGNLNFTFIASDALYDVNKQLNVIITALKKLGIDARFAGRNDIEVEGCKVSGNAFAKSNGNSLHHGTLLVNVQMDQLANYLNVSKAKMSSKGVDSVRKRVANLISFNPELSIDILKETLVESFKEVYQTELIPLTMDTIEIKPIIDKYASEQWRLNKLSSFDAQLETKFSWGEIQAFFTIHQGFIVENQIFSDAMSVELIEQLKSVWTQIPYDKQAMKQAARHLDDSLISDILHELFEEVTS